MRHFSISQLADMTGVDRRTAATRIEGLTFKVEGKSHLYDAREALPLIFDMANTEEKSMNKKLLDEQLRYESARADKVDLQNQKMRGELVAIEEIGQAVDKKFSAVRAGFLALPNKCAASVATMTSIVEVRAILEDAVNEVLQELTDDSKSRLEVEEHGSAAPAPSEVASED